MYNTVHRKNERFKKQFLFYEVNLSISGGDTSSWVLIGNQRLRLINVNQN